MTINQLARTLYYRLRYGEDSAKYTLGYMKGQFKATCYQHLHVFVESKVRHGTRDGKEHKPFDYPDPDGYNSYHMVISCTCGKEFS
jgi:hypothetical protein